MQVRPDCTLAIMCTTPEEFMKACESPSICDLPRLIINFGTELSPTQIKMHSDGDRQMQAVNAIHWHSDPVGFVSRMAILYSKTWGALVCRGSHLPDQSAIIDAANHLARHKHPFRSEGLWGCTRDAAALDGFDLIRPLGDEYTGELAVANASDGEAAPMPAVCEILCAVVPMFKVSISECIGKATLPVRELIESVRKEVASYDTQYPKCIFATSSVDLVESRKKVGPGGNVVLVDTKLPSGIPVDYDRRLLTTTGVHVVIYIGTT